MLIETDWNKEAALRVEYLNWLIDHNELPSLRKWFRQRGLFLDTSALRFPLDTESIFAVFKQTGVIFVNSDRYDAVLEDNTPMSYEHWLTLREFEQKRGEYIL